MTVSNSDRSFVPAPDGEYYFGEITPDIASAAGIPPGKIRLRPGDANTGLAHIEVTRGQMLREYFGSIENFVQYVAKNYDAIYQKKNSRDGDAYDMVVIRPPDEGMHGRLILRVEMDSEGGYYDVLSAMRMRQDQFKNKKPLWERTGTSAPSAEADPLVPEAKAAATMDAKSPHPNAQGDGNE